MRGRIVLVGIGIVCGAAVIGLLALLGMPPLFVGAWLLLIVGIAVVSRQSMLPEDSSWPPSRAEPPFRGSEVSRLAWAVNTSTGVVGLGLTRRLRTALRHRLAMHGLDLDDPADATGIDALLGPGIRTALDARAVHRDDVERVLTAIESIPPALERR